MANLCESESPASGRSRQAALGMLVYLGFFATASLLQWHSGAYRSEFGAHADEPAHVVTGLMVRDYLADGLWSGAAPMAFARDYYERYPKVALGHYPPAFYLVEGVWLLPVRSPAAVLVLMAALSAGAAWLTWRLARSHGLSAAWAWLPAALFVVHPLVRTYTSIVMSDLLLVIFCLLATDAWRRFLRTNANRHSLAFGIWATAAILTKGSGLFLALVPPLSILLTAKWRLLKCRALWLAPLPVLLFALPWMLATRHITAEGMSSTPLSDYMPEAVAYFAKHLPAEFGWLACGLRVIEGDLCDPEVCARACVGVDHVLHQAALGSVPRQREDWPGMESRVEGQTIQILEKLDLHNVKATFFLLGWVAERHPGLIRSIADAGHEIASHGYWHQLVYDLTPEEFRTDLERSLEVIEQLTGVRCKGYRAPSFSLRLDMDWAWDILAELGFEYDSSVYPVFHDRYGEPDAPRFPFTHSWAQSSLVEVPMSTVRLFGKNLAVAGGGYLRLYPYCITRGAIRNLGREGHAAIIYTHPWEWDPQQPKPDISKLKLFRHRARMTTVLDKFERLFNEFEFGTIEALLGQSSPAGADAAVQPSDRDS